MADSTIANLTDGTTAEDTDRLPVERSPFGVGQNRYITPAYIRTNIHGTYGTGVATALGVNVGSAGAFVTFNGAGGTPSSLTLTNATGLPVGGISATGTPGATTYLRGDGAWATPSGSGGITWVTKTSNYNAASGDFILCDTSGGALTITLPGTPSANDAVTIKSGYSAATNAVTVARNGNEIMNLTEDMTINTPNLEITLVYNATTGWTL